MPAAIPPPVAAMNSQLPSPSLLANGTNGPALHGDSISQDEVDLYDRQIRLWGLQAQENIRKANILLVSMKALANEIAKNLVLAGIGSLTILDSDPVTQQDLETQFFVSHADVDNNRAQAAAPRLQRLNNRVKTKVETSPVLQKLSDQDFLTPYDVVIATDLPWQTMTTLNAAAQLARCKFYAVGSYGFYGYIFTDLISHEFVLEREKSNIRTRLGPETPTRDIVNVQTKRGDDGRILEMVTKREKYSHIMLANTSPLPEHIQKDRRKIRRVTPVLACLRAYWELEGEPGWDRKSGPGMQRFNQLAKEKHAELQLPPEVLTDQLMMNFLRGIGQFEVPITAFLGGLAAQDIINVLGQKQQPIQNFMIFDGEDMTGPIFALHPRPVNVMPNGINGVSAGTAASPIDGGILIE